MGTFILLAWRNLWRNRHRTLITTASVFFAVILVLFIRSMQIGAYDHMITTTLQIHTGFIQIQGEDFQETRSLDESMAFEEGMLREVASVRGVTDVVPRIESFALASSQDRTRGVMLTGIDPDAENKMNNLSRRLVEGSYLDTNSQAVLIAQGVAEYLRAQVGDTLIFLGQGFYGMSAAGAFVINGIVDLPLPDLQNSMVYTTLDNAQWFYSMPGRVTSVALMIDDPDRMDGIAQNLRGMFTDGYEVITWPEILPELVQIIELDNAQGIIMLGILYMVIAFGVFGTVMMMMAERRREFAVMISIGMNHLRVSVMVLLETLVIGILGTITGIVASVPLLFYMKGNPIELTGTAAEAMREFGWDPLLPFAVEFPMFLNQGMVVMAISVVACLYPIYSINKIRLSDELRG
ncbi:ABC-type transport system, involved in lipoprotein release, permease component [Chitinispirillum alkaliphilum]|nr:ABC-type transport system, involved in lipoprotein release, permease component [Chitinispirillum alkaliphilum]